MRWLSFHDDAAAFKAGIVLVAHDWILLGNGAGSVSIPVPLGWGSTSRVPDSPPVGLEVGRPAQEIAHAPGIDASIIKITHVRQGQESVARLNNGLGVGD